MGLSESEIEERLERWPVARLATLARDGSPRQVPVVFARAAGALWSPIDGKRKSGRELARVRDVRERPRVALLLDHYDEDWERLWWIAVDAEARVIRVDRAHPTPEQRAAIEALERKYPQYRRTPLFAEPPTLLLLAPTRIRSWRAQAG